MCDKNCYPVIFDRQAIVEEFTPRAFYVHMRNVVKTPDGGLIESGHMEGDIDMYMVMKAVVREQRRRIREGKNGGQYSHGSCQLAL